MRRISLSRTDFSAVSNDKRAKRVSSEHFSLVISGAGIGTAVVVSKKVAKSSVARHSIKRRVREAIAPFSYFSEVDSPERSALIVYARAGAATLSYQEITAELSPLLKNSNQAFLRSLSK